MTGRFVDRPRGRRARRRGPLNVLVVVAHPRSDSFTRAIADTAISALDDAGHQVDTIDLYAEQFRPAMSLAERQGYPTGDCLLDDQARAHAAKVRASDALVFVYPTWWSGFPAILKGWLDRILVVGVAFDFHERTGKVRPSLRRMRHLVGISTYGSSRAYVKLVNDNGRRTLHRALWMICAPWTRRTWLALYSVDTASPQDRARFLDHVDRRLRLLDQPRTTRWRSRIGLDREVSR